LQKLSSAGIPPICQTKMVPYQNHNHFLLIRMFTKTVDKKKSALGQE